ncbi:hypothetical protein BKA82DRAFT_4348492 [Pisolithus tinctorius]|nr:hypothetical protein BKA82DRAFT_4348492 [Pisolithus tinctorius]
MADPNLKQHPNFKSVAFHKIHKAIMANLNINLDQAAEANKAQHLENEHREAEDTAHRQAAEGPEYDCREAEHKKPQMNNFTAGHPPSSVIINRPSQYATNKLTTCNYIKLWYFSPEGCSNAARNSHCNADNTFSLSSTNDILTLRPVASVKASQNVHADHHLTFSEFLQARVTFLHHIKVVPWPEKHINTLAVFFWNLKSHPQHMTMNRDAIILTYASCMCWQWHLELKANNGHIFDISIISDTLMNSIMFKVNNAVQKKLACRSVHTLPSHPKPNTNPFLHHLPPSSSHSLPPFSHPPPPYRPPTLSPFPMVWPGPIDTIPDPLTQPPTCIPTHATHYTELKLSLKPFPAPPPSPGASIITLP